MMIRYLKNFTNKVSYIYHQREDGHGISKQSVPKDTQLLIIVDSSTNEVEKCEEISKNNVDIIILDHHPKDKENPYALIVNNQICRYPNKNLSGSGIVYKTLEVLDDLLKTNYHKGFIDLCGIGIYSDVMSTKEPENRYLIYQALKNISNLGIKAILEAKRINPKFLNSQSIAYDIAPVVNAVARLNRIELIIELLLEDNYDTCKTLAKECVKLNENRKKIESKLFKQVKDKIDISNKIIILVVDKNDNIDKGFQGLLATRIANRYKKPCLVIKNENEICSGSGRSINNIKLNELLQETNLFDFIQGHSGAFGCSIKADRIGKVIQIVNEKLKDTENNAIIHYDLEVDIEDIDLEFIKKLNWFNYLAGKDAEYTKVLVKNLPVRERKLMGSNLDTIKIVSNELNLIKFKANELYAADLKDGDRIDAIGTLNINYFWHNGKKEIIVTKQLLMDDFRMAI